MKTKNYEKKELIIVLVLIMSIVELISIIFLFSYKKYTYKKLNAIVVKDNLVTLILDKEERKLLYNNKKIYLNDKIVSYKVIEDRGKVLERDNKDYYELLIEINFSKNKKVNEILELSINYKKKRIIEMLKEVWDGE